MKLTPEFEADIRQRVNPLYVNQRGTESHERAALLGEIDRLRDLLAAAKWPAAPDDRHAAQAEGKHPAPCGRFCEANAFEIELRQFRSALKKANSQAEHFEREWYLRGDEIESLRAELAELAVLKRSVSEWKDASNTPVTGMFGIAERDALIKAENALEQSFDMLTCKKCGGDMQPGQAIAQTFTGSPDFIGGEVCTVSPGGPGKLVECSKCPECGWSTT